MTSWIFSTRAVVHAASLTLLIFGFQSVIIIDEIITASRFTEPEHHNQCNDGCVRGMISTISLYPYSDFMSGNFALGRRGPRHEHISSFQVNLILSSGHLMREFLMQLASERSFSDECWQRLWLIFEPGDGVLYQYFL